MDRRPRVSGLGETSVIAAITATAYMVSLSYRAAQMFYLGLPVTLAAVRLSDAVFAGVFVLVGGFGALVLGDVLESHRPGSLEAISSWSIALPAAVLVILPVLATLVALASVASIIGWMWTLLLAALVNLSWFSVCWRLVKWLLSAQLKAETLSAMAKKYPVPVFAVVIAAALCLCAWSFGWSGLSFSNGYAKTATTNEVAVAIFEDRAVLVGVEPTEGNDATLTGAFRVVPLPSETTSFSAEHVRRLLRKQ